MYIKKDVRVAVHNKYNEHCAYCGGDLEYNKMQVDHFIPKRKFGFDDQSVDFFRNLMPSCRSCNHYKRARDIETFRRLLLRLPDKLASQSLVKVAGDYGIISVKVWDGVFYYERMEFREGKNGKRDK